MLVEDVLTYYRSLLGFSQKYLRVPGVQAAVYAGDRVALSCAFGHADVANGVELTERHLFRIASHSKTFTAVAVMRLVERDRLRLDDTAGQHVPELGGTQVGDLTVRDLLAHAAGVIRDSKLGDFWQLDREFPDRDQLLAILKEPDAVVLPANDRFKYSNIGYGLLGLIVEAAAGKTYAEFVEAEIVDRLGLSDLGPELDPARADDYAVGYSSLSYATERVPIEHVDTRALAAATGFYGTARDVVRYFSAHFLGDERLISDGSKRLMQHPLWSTKSDSDEQRYGLGLSYLKIGELEAFGHGGGYPGHITRTLVDAERRVVVSVLTNAIDGPAPDLAQALLKLLDLADRDPGPSIDVSGFAGRFANLWGVRDIAPLGGRLYLLDPSATDPTADAFPLDVVDDRTLRVAGGSGYGNFGEPITYDFRDDGTIRTVRGPSGKTLHPLDAFTLPARVTVRSP